MSIITPERIHRFAPLARPDVVNALCAPGILDAAGINKPLRCQHFMAQIYVESWALSRLEENLNYSAQRAHEVFPSHFPTVASALAYASNPKAFANKVYGGRLGNRLPDDGWTFRGSGLLDTTGRDNFRAAGHENDPETLRTPVGAVASALKFWGDHGCNALADADQIVRESIVINGGKNGLPDRIAALTKAKQIFV